MKFAVSKTITIDKTEREILTRFEAMIDEMDLDATQLEQLLFDIYRGKTGSDDIFIKYEDD